MICLEVILVKKLHDFILLPSDKKCHLKMFITGLQGVTGWRNNVNNLKFLKNGIRKSKS